MAFKLYELIELGSTLVEEDHCSFLEDRGSFSESRWCGCALGTAYAGGTKLDHDIYTDTLGEMVSTLIDLAPTVTAMVTCPACVYGKHLVSGRLASLVPGFTCGQLGDVPVPLIAVVEHLHSIHLWPRQEIADWLRTFEDSLPEAVSTESEEVQVPLEVI